MNVIISNKYQSLLSNLDIESTLHIDIKDIL